MRHDWTAHATALRLFLASTLVLGACGGGADDAPNAESTEATAQDGAAEGGTFEDAMAEIEAKQAEVREETDAPDIDVCALLDPDALIEIMPKSDYNPVQAKSTDGLFGPVCSFSGGKGGQNLTARVGASSLTLAEELGVHQDAAEMPEVGDGVRYYFNPNFTDQRSYVFEARGLTFKVTTMFDDEQASRDFAAHAVAMVRE